MERSGVCGVGLAPPPDGGAPPAQVAAGDQPFPSVRRCSRQSVLYPSPREVTTVGLMDKVRGMFGQHGDKVDQGIDKAGDVVDDKTGGQHAAHVDKAQDAAKDGVDKLTGEGGDGAR
jgi:hypothetical protein